MTIGSICPDRADLDAGRTTPRAAGGWTRAGRVALHLAVAVSPVVTGFGLLRWWLGDNPGYLPVQSDELSYWHQIMTFAETGFGNGYYTYQEQVPPALSAYGPWGPAFPLLYGTVLGALGGTGHPMSVVWLNAAFLVALVFTALHLGRPGRRRALLLGALLTTWLPLLLFVPTGMQEPLHLGLGVLLGVLFARLIAASPQARRQAAVTLCAAVVVAGLLRPTWALLLIPAAALVARGQRPRRAAAVVAAGAAGAAVVAALFPLWAAPFPYGATYRIRSAPTIAAKAGMLVDNALHNLGLYLRPDAWVVSSGVVARYLVLVLLATAVVVAVRAWPHRRRTAWTATTAALALAAPLALLLTVYDIGSGTRVLAAHSLFALVLLASGRPRWPLALPALAIVVNIATIPWFRADFVAVNTPDHRGDAASVAATRAVLDTHLRYRPGAGRWCNTLLVATGAGLYPELAAVPPGIGISVDFDHRFTGPLRSAHIITTDAVRPLLPGGDRLVFVADTAGGTLYRNPGSPCSG